MERTYINEVQKEIGSTVKVQGFIEKTSTLTHKQKMSISLSPN